eukprot:TRINITY_DN609_c0_g1_i1.p1 TRINITY_DN609_c0_g1~~TRINITY_DN609_c0_g1_i1.p1  ORF type:complete len:120 (-),score=9.27 TRINITY_DN609_c0_g1_i1:323-682(-)
MEHIEQTLESRARGFSEPLPPGQPPYQDLLDSYWNQEEIVTTFRRTITSPNTNVATETSFSAAPFAQGSKNASPWKEYTDENSGDPYYYNEETGESSWDKPPELQYARTLRVSVASRGW